MPSSSLMTYSAPAVCQDSGCVCFIDSFEGGTQRVRTQREADGCCRSCPPERGATSLVWPYADFDLLLEVPSGRVEFVHELLHSRLLSHASGLAVAERSQRSVQSRIGEPGPFHRQMSSVGSRCPQTFA